MSEILGLDTGIDFSVGALSSWTWYLVWIFGFLVICILAAVVIWWMNQKKIYKEEVAVFENISGQGWVLSFKDRARRLRLSKDGTEVLYLKKKKMPLTAYGRKMGPHQFWFAIGQDGGYYNFVLGDLDSKMGILDIELVDRDIKLLTVAMLKNAESEYGPQKSFMDKWGVWVFSIIGLIIAIAGASYLISQMGDVANSLSSALGANQKVVESLSQIVGRMDSLANGGSGTVSA